jgi:hypothetical protein
MSTERPASYRPETWNIIAPQLEAMSQTALVELAERAGIDGSEMTKEVVIEALTHRGPILLIELGLVARPETMNGTLFSHGGLEFVIDREAANMLAAGEGSARLEVLGGGKSRAFTYSELMKALRESPDFDQRAPR